MAYKAIVIVLLCLACCSCETGAGRQGASGPAGQAPNAGLASLQAPSALPKDSAAITGYALLGREFTPAIPPNLVAAEGDQARFSPTGGDLAGAAYAGYRFSLEGAAGALELQFEWEIAPAITPEQPVFWLGLANWEADAWQWTAPASATRLNIADVAPFLRPGTGSLYLIVLVSGTEPALLNELGFPAATPPDTGPRVESVAPLGGAPGAQVKMQPEYFSLQPFDITWDFGGGAEPNTSSEPYPEITLGPEGVYNCNVSVSNADGSGSFDFTLHVSEQLFFACGRLGTNNWPLGGVTIQLTGTVETIVQSDMDGWYTITDLPNGDYTVTPTNHDCVPDHIDFTINNNFRTDLDFHEDDGQLVHGIMGPIINQYGVEMMTCDVQVTGPVNEFNPSGVAFFDLPDGEYRVTPCEAGIKFWPPYRDITLEGYTIHGVVFLAYLDAISTFDISGTVTLAETGLPAEGVRFSIEGMGQELAVTDANGHYEVKGLNHIPSGGLWAVKIYVPDTAATFTPKYGYLIQDETQTTGKDFVMTVVE